MDGFDPDNLLEIFDDVDLEDLDKFYQIENRNSGSGIGSRGAGSWGKKRVNDTNSL